MNNQKSKQANILKKEQLETNEFDAGDDIKYTVTKTNETKHKTKGVISSGDQLDMERE